jgi:Bacterial transcriptional activator domain
VTGAPGGAFESMRRRLGDELGIDPGPALRMQHQRVLQADHRLTAQCAATAGVRPPVGVQPAVPAGGGARVDSVIRFALPLGR